jgi:hypothetical protein
VLWRDVDLDLGVSRLTSTLVAGGRPDPPASGVGVIFLASGVPSASAAVLRTVDRTFRDPRTVTRWLVEACERHGFEGG